MVQVFVEDLVNQSARKLGVRRRVGTIYEGSELAKASLEVYGQTRRELLREKDWGFPARRVPLVLQKGPPPPGGYNPALPWNITLYAPPGWLYEYAYPADAIQIAAIVPPPFLMPDRDPKPVTWTDGNDQTLNAGNILTGGGSALTGGGAILTGGVGVNGSGTRVILTNQRQAIAVYRGDVVDPNMWPPGFTQVFIARLAEALAIALGANLQLMTATATMAGGEEQIADKRRG
jgi:hypothetical protein